MKAILISFAFLALVFQSCEPDFQNSDSAFSVVSVRKQDGAASDFAKLYITVRNNSGYCGSCAAYIKIKNGNTVIEHSSVVFSSLNQGESQVEEAWFSKFESHSEYDQAVVELYWTIDGIDYSKTYTY